MIKSYTEYTIRCDNQTNDCDYLDYYMSPEEAEKMAKVFQWEKIGKKHICPTCLHSKKSSGN